MYRNYIILSGMQLFSPSSQGTTNGKGLHLPYEVFLDDLCETVEYERIVMHTSCVVQYDKYNRLRLSTATQSTPHSVSFLYGKFTDANNHVYRTSFLQTYPGSRFRQIQIISLHSITSLPISFSMRIHQIAVV
jgi:hypothetical protein